jgi:hypothetical protein
MEKRVGEGKVFRLHARQKNYQIKRILKIKEWNKDYKEAEEERKGSSEGIKR